MDMKCDHSLETGILLFFAAFTFFFFFFLRSPAISLGFTTFG